MDTIINYLYIALADELLSSYQYWTARHSARGRGRNDAIPEFQAHEAEEREHAEKIMLRLKELGCKPIPDPVSLTQIGNEWTPITNCDVVNQAIILAEAEAKAVEFYKDALLTARASGDDVSAKLFKEILSDEEEHRYDMDELRYAVVEPEPVAKGQAVARKRLSNRRVRLTRRH